jgi:DNA-binding response OmpR family regulator
MRKLILLVDDKETIAKVASIYLGKDYDIQYFPDPIHAYYWSMLKQRWVTVVLLRLSLF